MEAFCRPDGLIVGTDVLRDMLGVACCIFKVLPFKTDWHNCPGIITPGLCKSGSCQVIFINQGKVRVFVCGSRGLKLFFEPQSSAANAHASVLVAILSQEQPLLICLRGLSGRSPNRSDHADRGNRGRG